MKQPIYFTCLHLQTGGVEKCIAMMANHFVALGHPVTIWCTYDLGTPAYHVDERVRIDYLTALKPNRQQFKEAVAQRRIGRILAEGWTAVRVLYHKKKRLIERIKSVAQGIIIATRDEDAVLLSRHGAPSVRRIFHMHHDSQPHPHISKHAKTAYGGLDDLVVLSPLLVDELQEEMRGHNTHTHVRYIPNAVADRPLDVPVSVHRSAVFVSVGRLSPEKGMDRLLTAWVDIVAQHPEYHLHIIGDGTERAALMEQAAQIPNVHFLGMLSGENVRAELMRAEALLATPYTDGFGLVFLEAMNLGTPCVAYDVRLGPRTIMEDGVTGYLVPDGDVAAFVHAVNQLIDMDDTERLALAQRVVNRAAEFTLDQVMTQWQTLFVEER